MAGANPILRLRALDANGAPMTNRILGLARTTDAPTKLAPLFVRALPNLTDLVITESDELDLCELLMTAPFAPQLTA